MTGNRWRSCRKTHTSNQAKTHSSGTCVRSSARGDWLRAKQRRYCQALRQFRWRRHEILVIAVIPRGSAHFCGQLACTDAGSPPCTPVSAKAVKVSLASEIDASERIRCVDGSNTVRFRRGPFNSRETERVALAELRSSVCLNRRLLTICLEDSRNLNGSAVCVAYSSSQGIAIIDSLGSRSQRFLRCLCTSPSAHEIDRPCLRALGASCCCGVRGHASTSHFQ